MKRGNKIMKINRVFEFIENGKVIDEFIVNSRRDFEMLLDLKAYAEKRGVIVKEK